MRPYLSLRQDDLNWRSYNGPHPFPRIKASIDLQLLLMNCVQKFLEDNDKIHMCCFYILSLVIPGQVALDFYYC